MTRAELHNVASAVYGRTWQAELARALAINVRTVRRWASGDAAIPAAREIEIISSLRKRASQSLRDTLATLVWMKAIR